MLSDRMRGIGYCDVASTQVAIWATEVAALEAQNEGYGQLLGSANNDVERLSEYTDTLEARAQRLTEAVEVLSGPANGWVDYCMLNKLLPRRLCGDKTLDTQCREVIAKEALDA